MTKFNALMASLLLFAPGISFAHTASSKTCLRLLTAEPVKTHFTPDEMLAALTWSKQMNGFQKMTGFEEYAKTQGMTSDEASEVSVLSRYWARYALTQWKRWGQITEAQRMAALNLELDKLSSVPTSNVIQVGRSDRLSELSSANLRRMTKQLDRIYPVPTEILRDRDLIAKTSKVVILPRFVYLSTMEAPKGSAHFAPLVSALQLRNLGLQEREPGFYQQLVQNSATTGFRVFAAADKEDLSSVVHHDTFLLNSAFATQNGFVLPTFSDANDLLQFFKTWDPEALENLRKYLRFSLPQETTSVDQMLEYLEPARATQFFSAESAFSSLTPLRTRLSQFVLSETDARTFLRRAFQRFLLYIASFNRDTFEQVTSHLKSNPKTVTSLFEGDFMKSLGMSGLSLRVPLSVSPTAFTIIRHEPAVTRLLTDFGAQPQALPQRLDHDLMP